MCPDCHISMVRRGLTGLGRGVSLFAMPVKRRSFLLGLGSAIAVTVSLIGTGLIGSRASAAVAGHRPAGPGGQAAARDRLSPGRASATRRRPIRVGSVLIPPCAAAPLAWCTTIKVPFNYFNAAAGRISIGFRWYPADGKPGAHARTIVAVEGGPGFATTGTAPDYRAMLGPLLRTRNLLLMDLRGTGTSSPVTCKALQDWTLLDSIASYTADTGACGRQLNHTRKLVGGHGYVQASDLYTTANAARDLARGIRALKTGPVDLYGDSYGTFFSQTFTSRYPKLLRSVTLDAAYPVGETDPFYPLMIPAARTGFNLACERSVACQAAAPGSSWARIGRAARYLRAHPVIGQTRGPFGRIRVTRVGVNELIELVNIAGADSGVYRELDPAIRALLSPSHDAVPLLRLTAQEIVPTESSGPVKEFSAGLYQAVTCLDYPQPFSYKSSMAQCRKEYARALARLAPSAFAPFTVHEWGTEPEEEFDACLSWPAPAHPHPPITKPAPWAPRSLPVLVLSGDLDSLTTPAEGRITARKMGPSARWILVHNDVHVNALDDPVGCAQGLVRKFIEHP